MRVFAILIVCLLTSCAAQNKTYFNLKISDDEYYIKDRLKYKNENNNSYYSIIGIEFGCSKCSKLFSSEYAATQCYDGHS